MIHIRYFLEALNLLQKGERAKVYIFLFIQFGLAALDSLAIFLISVVTFMAGNDGNYPAFVRKVAFIEESFIDLSLPVILVTAIVLFLLKSLLSLIFTKILLRDLSEISDHFALDALRITWKMNPLTYKSESARNLAIGIIDGSKALGLGVIGYILIIISESFLLVIVFIATLFIAPILTLLLLPILIFGIIYIQKQVSETAVYNGQVRVQTENRLRIWLFKMGNLSTFIKESRNTKGFENYFQTNISSANSANANLHYIQQFPKYSMEILVMVCGATVLMFYGLNGNMQRGLIILGLIIAASSRILPSLLRVQGAVILLKTLNFHIELILAIFRSKEAVDVRNNQRWIIVNESNLLVPKIQIANLNFSYPDGATIFKNFNAEILPGRVNVVTGRSGSGKSTLINLILGNLDSIAGSISMNIARGERICTSIMMQNTEILEGTLIENVALGVDVNEIDLDLVHRSLRHAGLDDLFVIQLSNSEEWWNHISGGERQRIGLARALYLEPNFLILDEPTSSLDSKAEASLFETFKTLSAEITILMVSHSKNVHKYFDSIIALDQ